MANSLLPSNSTIMDTNRGKGGSRRPGAISGWVIAMEPESAVADVDGPQANIAIHLPQNAPVTPKPHPPRAGSWTKCENQKASLAMATRAAIWPIQNRNIHLMISALMSAPSCFVINLLLRSSSCSRKANSRLSAMARALGGSI